MILIADSGSSKTSWAGLHNGQLIFSYETSGLNPNFIGEEEFKRETDELALQLPAGKKITHIYFYGAGCSSEKNKEFVRNKLAAIIPANEIEVYSDLQGAALAISAGKKSIAAIIGTGSNACLFDGLSINYSVPSYGYILGDHGSGASIGKKTLQKYFDGELPLNVIAQFSKWLGLSDEEIIAHIYKRSRPNRFLATLTLFHALHPDESSLRKIRLESFHDFFIRQISKIENAHDYEINFCGSVAWVFREEIRFVAEQAKFRCGTFVKSPMEGLITFHKT